MSERIHTMGTVVDWDHHRIGVGPTPEQRRSVPVVRFTTQDGREIESSPSSALDLGIYRTGQAAEVWYDPDDPRDVQVRINGTRRPVLAFVGAAVLALLFLFVALPLIFSRLG